MGCEVRTKKGQPELRGFKKMGSSGFPLFCNSSKWLQSSIMRGIDFKVVWPDEDPYEYYVRCSNGFFSGATTLYSGPDFLASMADVLNGFPLHAKDCRSLEIGTFDSRMAGGGIQMQLFCVDSVGHSVAVLRLRGNGCKAMGEPQSVCLSIPVEAGAIDSFVRQARSLGDGERENAYLQMADDTVPWVQKWVASNQS